MTWWVPSERVNEPSLPVTPAPPLTVPPAETSSGGQAARQPPEQVDLLVLSVVRV